VRPKTPALFSKEGAARALVLFPLSFKFKVVSDGAGFACGRPSFLSPPKKEGKKCGLGLLP